MDTAELPETSQQLVGSVNLKLCRLTVSNRTERLAVTESLANPVNSAAIAHEAFRVLTRRDEYGVEQCRALPFKVVIRDDACTLAHCLAFGVDLPATWANDPGGRLTCGPNGANSFNLQHIKSIRNENGYAACGDCGILGSEECLRKGGIGFAMIWT